MADRYIVKGGFGGSWRYDLVDEPHIFYQEVETRTLKRGPFGAYYEVKGTGRFTKSKLQVTSHQSRRTIDATAADLKTAVRVLRDREAAGLAEIDAEIARLKDAMTDAQTRKKAALAHAFSMGNVFTVKEATAIADRRLAEREARHRAEAER